MRVALRAQGPDEQDGAEGLPCFFAEEVEGRQCAEAGDIICVFIWVGEEEEGKEESGRADEW